MALHLPARNDSRKVRQRIVAPAAMTAAPKGVCINVIGTNFMNYPGFREAAGAEDEKVYQSILK